VQAGDLSGDMEKAIGNPMVGIRWDDIRRRQSGRNILEKHSCEFQAGTERKNPIGNQINKCLFLCSSKEEI
jgi:hypothetical protein